MSWKRHGEPGIVVQPKGLPLAERFAQYVGQTLPNGCILWAGPTNEKGYGMFRLSADRRGVAAHRVALLISTGEEPRGAHGLHTCPDGDNPLCVNPAHLRWADNAANMSDRWERGHYASTTKIPDDHLATVRERVARGETYAAVAATYGVVPTTIRQIVKGRRRALVT